MANFGLPIAKFTSRPKRGMQVLFVIWMIFIIAILLESSKLPALGAFGFSSFFIILAGLTAILAFAEERTLEIYEDKFLLRRTKDDLIRESVEWKDIKDITWPVQDNQRVAIGGAMFGMLGILMLALVGGLDRKRSTPEPKTLWLDFNIKRRRLVLDSRYRDAAPTIHQVAVKSWVSNIINALEKNETVAMGKLQVTQQGIRKGDQWVEWATITNIEYSADLQNIEITYRDPLKKKPQKLRQSLGYKGYALVEVTQQMNIISQFQLPEML